MLKNCCKSFIVLFFISIALSFSGVPGEPESGFTSEDYFNFEWVSDPRLSPDGKTIVYVRHFADIVTDKFYSNLWSIRFDGSGNRPLTSGLYHDSSPRWSPDGRTLIYVSDRNGKSQIYKRWMDTGQTVVLTNLLFGPTGISWSPDGKWIAYSAPVPCKSRTIVQMPSAPAGADWAPPPKIIDKTIYRFDGIGYQVSMGYMHLFVMPSEGGAPKQLSKGSFHHPFPASGGRLEWSPDSKSILLSACRKEDWELDLMDSEIHEFTLIDGKMTVLTDRNGPDDSPVISPDGKLIAYKGFDDRFQGYQVTRLYVMDRDGSNPRPLTTELDRTAGQLQWAKDGKAVFFTYTDKGNTKLAMISLKGKITKLADDLGDGRIAYEGGEYLVASNGNFVYTLTRPDHASDLAVASVDNPGIRIITSVNQDIFGHKKLAEVEEIWYESAKDGRKIHGWIMKPPRFDPSKKYPLILEIHGGPFANYGSRFSVEKQLLAGAGYVVLFTNPRGSTGYGEEFGNLIHHAYPGDDFYDLNSGVDAVIARGYIDEENVYVTGGSGGGILTCWMIGRTRRFRAAASLYPVINWYSWVLTTDIAPIGLKYWFPDYPWNMPEHYESRSLLSVVGNVTTPTMIITGEEDWRCPMSESEQYYMALKLLGKEAVLVRYPEANHGLFPRPSQNLSRMLHIISWFDRHKKHR